MADSGRGRHENPGESPSASPGSGTKRVQQSPGCRAKYQVSAPGHCFRKVTLTKPTFCHHCSDFIWGLVGYICEVCNFMSHEKCLKLVRTVCSCLAMTLVRVPVAHCFGPAGQKKRFCCVCRKNLEGTPALRCEVCELHVHSDCAPFSCSDCRVCHQDGGEDCEMYHHHWREGNMASGARCEVCRRTCSSSEVLAGMRCEWCGLTAHASCYITVPVECSLGRLCRMTLHPSCVRLCSRNFSKMHCYRISEPLQQGELDNLDDVDVPSPAAPKENQSSTSSDTGKQTLKVFDGDDAVKRNQFRLVSIPRATKKEEVVEAALRAFYVANELQEYVLVPYTPQGLLTDDIINRNGAPDNKGVFKDSSQEAWLLRAKPRETEQLKVYVGSLKVGVTYISTSVGKSSTVDSVIKELLTQLIKQDENPADFNLVEVFMGSKQVQRQVLAGQDFLLDKLREIQKISLRQMSQTRFYLLASRNRVVQVELLLCGLPPQLCAEEYSSLLQQHLAMKSHLVTITHVYSEQGAVALQISCFAEAERIYMLAKDTCVNDKQLTSLVIPQIMQSKLPQDSSPLLVFVNPKSGGLKGREILYGFRKLLNPHQVFELRSGGPLPGLHTFRDVPHFRILVCGGDGTVGWVLGMLESVRHMLACPEPAISIVPLGTGNDLARVLRWGTGYSGEDPYNILVSVDEAEEVEMDRWTILLDAQEMTADGQHNGFLEPPKIVHMNNYFGLGIDAELSLDFHHAREEEPGKFNSRFHNKGVYVKVGLQKISHTRNLHKDLRLQVDTQEVELPSIEGLILLNIPSWGSGADLWGSDNDSRFGKPRIDDGMLELVGVTGVVHMGQVQSGLRSGIRIAQGSYIRITLTKPIPVQVDGEPWIQGPGQVIISAAGPKVRMLRKSKAKQKKQSGSLKDSRSEAGLN
ncbi:diacylglycerol kinase theta [Electrophorus electricus]|uniref:diacylglycerol kinase theta n=1 Tax=Electrophorus electricus TaxID=8005 RepID=UPI0015D0906E|nr:diacylglycerol kinase theta [Electrophorus electricus]